jgi:hypothetical protein
MKAKNFTSAGALHPILFFAVMYVVVLLLSVFICSSLFYTFNSDSYASDSKTESSSASKSMPIHVSTAAMVR